MKVCLVSDTHAFYSTATQFVLKWFWRCIAREDFDVLIHAGDWATRSFSSILPSLDQLRSAIDKPVLTVLGNHDLWLEPSDLASYEIIKHQLREWFEMYDILYLSEKSFVRDSLIITGFDGWYSNTNPPTKDCDRLPNDVTMSALSFNTQRSLERVFREIEGYEKRVCVTHFPPFDSYGRDSQSREYMGANPKYLEFLKANFQIVCVGHDHQAYDRHFDSCRVINPGGNYDDPSFVIFEV